MVGLVTSVTVTVCVAVATFPLPSVTVQVTVVTPIGNATGALLVILATEQLSAVIGEPNATPVAVQPEFTLTLIATGAVIVGNTDSLTVTICVAVDVFPLPSVTVHVTVVAPSKKADGALLVTLATEQLSEVTGVPKTTPVAEQPKLAIIVIAVGATIVGFVISVTVTICVAVVVFPLLSVTVHVTVVVPNKNVVGALLVTLATAQLSEVTGVPKVTLNATHPLLAYTETFAGAVIVGLTVSVTVTVWVAVATLPLPSVMVHVTVVTPIGNVTGALLVTLAIVQLSDAIGVPKRTLVAVQPIALSEIFAGATIVGKVASITLTVCVAVVLLPLASVTVHVTVVKPSWKILGALLVTLAIVQLSKVIGVPNTTPVAVQPVFVLTVIAAGATIVGLIASRTLTVWVAVVLFPLVSVTVQVTVVIPIGKTTGALLVTVATEQLSEVTGVPKFTLNATQELLAFTVTLVGAVIIGFTESLTVTVCVAVAMFPLPSLTVQIIVVVPIG